MQLKWILLVPLILFERDSLSRGTQYSFLQTGLERTNIREHLTRKLKMMKNIRIRKTRIHRFLKNLNRVQLIMMSVEEYLFTMMLSVYALAIEHRDRVSS